MNYAFTLLLDVIVAASQFLVIARICCILHMVISSDGEDTSSFTHSGHAGHTLVTYVGMVKYTILPQQHTGASATASC